ncbi:geranylgeranyl pyrophosphate synthase [Longilinea arvoryzae]|uniref:Geranylgeranyl pyrophosphate synthase n=2 Tax=Longilinea arvoryzae TaxID=360412 RepID=A0A0S7BHK0_9CHLR|nr:geranylgeranyl pyrophosphate synthase [Longilinea arvoryzae]
MFILVSENLSAQFDHADARSPFVLLPSLCCQACGEPAERTIGVSLAWFLLQVSASLLDKVEDHELMSIQSAPSDASIITNLTTGMILVAQWILNHLELDRVDSGTAWDIQRAFHETTLSVCSGQHLDLSANSPDLSTCWQIAEAKSGAAFALACYAGARLATNRSDVLDAFFQFGRGFGTIVQIDDDLEDLANIGDHCSSWRMKKTLVNAYLKFAENSTSETRQNDRVITTKQFATHEPISSGSVLYLQLEKLKYATLAENALKRLNLAGEFQDRLISIIHHESRLRNYVN